MAVINEDNKIVLHGIITKSKDTHPLAIVVESPIIRANQEITIKLDEDFEQIIHLKDKRVTIVIDKD